MPHLPGMEVDLDIKRITEWAVELGKVFSVKRLRHAAATGKLVTVKFGRAKNSPRYCTFADIQKWVADCESPESKRRAKWSA